MNIIYDSIHSKGFVNLREFLAGFEVIHIDKNLTDKEKRDIFLHEYAHIIQLRKSNDRFLRQLIDSPHFNDIDFHDKQFNKILEKLI